MTGPAEWEFSGSFDPATGAWAREHRKRGLMAIDIVTFGCRLNTYESEVMRREAEAAGLGELDDGAVIFNTCAVTAEAVRQARQSIRKARREQPERPHHRHRLRRADRPDELCRHGRGRPRARQRGEAASATIYRALPDFGVNDTEKARVNDIMSVRETAAHMVDAIEGRARAFVQVQNGCDHRCTFCIIPYGRGNSRSVPMGAVVEQVEAARRQRLCRDRADRRRHDQLRRRPAGQPEARPAGEDDPAAGPGREAAAALLDRFDRGGCRPARGDRRRSRG